MGEATTDPFGRARRSPLGLGHAPSAAQIRDPALLAQAKALTAKLEPPKVPNSGFGGESGLLAAFETSAESSDAAPTAALRETAAEVNALVARDWANWQQIQASDLASL